MLFGAHVSIAGGIDKAPLQAAEFGGEVFQIFSRPPQGGPAPTIDNSLVEQLHKNMELHHQNEFYIHTPYIINLASSDRRIAENSVRIISEELTRASMLGGRYVMTHLGSAKGRDAAEANKVVGENLKRILDKVYETELLIEISAGAGEIIGDTFEELAYFMEYLRGYKIGICLDIAHMFASGYDLRDNASVQKTFDLFERVVGLQYLRLFHLNDSQVGLGERKDRHEHLGDGKIGSAGFEALVQDTRLWPFNFVLETELLAKATSGERKVVQDIRIMKEFRRKHVSDYISH